MRASEGKRCNLSAQGHPNLPLRSTSKYFKFQIVSSGLRGVLSWIDRYGAVSSSRKSALSALYLAAARLISEPFMTTAPSVVHTHHRHVRPRFFKATSKTGNWSRHCDRALRSAFKGAPENGKGHLPGWSVETHNWSMEMRSLFRVVKPSRCGVRSLEPNGLARRVKNSTQGIAPTAPLATTAGWRVFLIKQNFLESQWFELAAKTLKTLIGCHGKIGKAQ
jgi:hypothetical protein